MQHVTFVGNAAAAPDLAFSANGVASVRLSVIVQDRYRDKTGAWVDGPTHTVWVSAFRDFAERIAASVNKGDRVVVTGTFSTDKVERDGETKYYTNFIADDLGLSCRWAEVAARRVRGSRAAAGSGGPTQPPEPAAQLDSEDPWTPGGEPEPAGTSTRY